MIKSKSFELGAYPKNVIGDKDFNDKYIKEVKTYMDNTLSYMLIAKQP